MKYLILLFCLVSSLARAEFTLDTKVTVIEQFACNDKICGVALGEDNAVYFFVLDEKGLRKVYHKGMQVYCRDCKKI